MESNVSTMERLILDSVSIYVLRNGRTIVSMNGYTCLYTPWIPALEIAILRQNFAEVPRTGF